MATPNDFSELLLQVYALSRESPIERFQDAVLELLKPVLPFDSSMWGTATPKFEGMTVHTLHLHQKSPEMMHEYESLKHLDTMGSSMFWQPRAVRGFNTATWLARPHEHEFRDLLQRYEQNNVLIAVESNAQTAFMQWMSLFRADPDQYCRSEEEQCLHQLAPHLMQALNLNRVMHLGQMTPGQTRSVQRGAAIADFHGVIYHSDALFNTVLRQEFIHWNGQALPDPLMAHCRRQQGPTTFKGEHIVASHQVDQGLLFMSVRRRCLADKLSEREHTVAKLVCKGKTYKEIAQMVGRASATVRNQIQAIHTKLEVDNIAGVIEAMRLT